MRATSIAALESTDTAAIRQRVFDFLCEWGATCDDVEVGLDLTHQTASARVHELEAAEFIADTGLRRKTRSGRDAIVWHVVAGMNGADVSKITRAPLLEMEWTPYTTLAAARRWLSAVRKPARCPSCGHKVRPGKVKT